MHELTNITIFLSKQEAAGSVSCFGVFNNCRVDLRHTFDAQQQLLVIQTPINPQCLIVVDTPETSLEIAF